MLPPKMRPLPKDADLSNYVMVGVQIDLKTGKQHKIYQEKTPEMAKRSEDFQKNIVDFTVHEFMKTVRPQI